MEALLREIAPAVLGFYNKNDAEWVKSMLEKYKWTERETRAIHRSFANYQLQLKEKGVELPPAPSYAEDKYVKTRKATLGGGRIFVRTVGEDIGFYQTLPGWRTQPRVESQWSFPVNDFVISELARKGYSIDPKITEQQKKNEAKLISSKVETEAQVNLFPYQIEGKNLLHEMNGRAMLADDMGLGKSCQTIMYLREHPELRPAIIVVPASLKTNWVREFEKFGLDEDYTVINGKVRELSYHEKSRDNIVVINYDVLDSHKWRLLELDAKVLIADESHKLKTSHSRRTQAFKILAKEIEHLIFISGTQALSRPMELFVPLNLLAPEIFPSRDRFGEEFCGGKEKNYKSATNIDKLHVLVKKHMIRRLKKDVLKDLPPKIRSVISLDIDNRREYQRADMDFLDYLRETKGDYAAKKASFSETLVKFGALRRLAIQGKMEAVYSYLDDFLENDEKLIIFCYHRDTVDLLHERYKNVSVKHYGGISETQKQIAVDSFQNNANVKFFIGNIESAGVGINLTAASHVAFVELPWTPGALDQGEDRANRIGATGNCTNIYYLIATNTIEERMAALIDKKRLTLTALFDGGVPEEDTLLMALLDEYRMRAA
jgi:SWI/SNF-related matrix-associated actin-dependent regulator 1 of chromatin subfamily A